jgi:hypothetical protein
MMVLSILFGVQIFVLIIPFLSIHSFHTWSLNCQFPYLADYHFFCLGFSILQSVNLLILKGKEKINLFKWILYKFGLLWRRSTDREQGNEKWPMANGSKR